MNDYPEELRLVPTPLVALSGLPHLHSAVTDQIKQSSGVEAMRAYPLRFLSVAHGATFPPRKEQRLSHEGYRPGGILKANWMHKHLNLIPSMLAVFVEWDVTDTNWRSLETRVCALLDTIRSNNVSRVLRLLVVLVQSKQASVHDVEERVRSLHKSAGLDGKSVCLLQMFDLEASVQRLERQLYEGSVAFYRDEARRIKKIKEKVSRTTQPELLVRLHFKIAFYAFMRREIKSAVKYLHAAYNSLYDVPRVSDHVYELKVMAEWVNFLLCRTYLEQNHTRAAVDQFHAHIKAYGHVIGVQKVAFQHYAWMARQYRVFAELLEHAQHGMTSVASDAAVDHVLSPSFYYQAAASNMVQRKHFAQVLCKDVALNDALVAAYTPEQLDLRKSGRLFQWGTYVGQVRVPEGVVGTVGELLVQEELAVDHTQLILDLLSKTRRAVLEHRGKANTTRQVLYVACQMAKQHFDARSFDSAKKLYDLVYPRYRREQWWPILSSILEQCRVCAHELGLAQEELQYMLELMSSVMTLPPERKKAIQSQVLAMVGVGGGGGDGGGGDASTFVVDCGTFGTAGLGHLLVQCRAFFEQRSVYPNDEMVFVVRMVAHSPEPLNFSSLEVTFNDDAYSRTLDARALALADGDDDVEDLSFGPGQSKCFRFRLKAQESRHLECVRVRLSLARLHFEWSKPSEEAHGDQWSCTIRPPEPKVALEFAHSPPALHHEWYPLDIVLCTHEDHVRKGAMTFEVTPPTDAFFYTLDANGEPQPLPAGGLPIGEVVRQAKQTFRVVVCARKAEDKKLKVQVDYETAQGYQTSLVVEDFYLPVVSPLLPRFKLYGDQLPQIKAPPKSTQADSRSSTPTHSTIINNTAKPVVGPKLCANRDVVVMMLAELKCVSPHDITVHRVAMRQKAVPYDAENGKPAGIGEAVALLGLSCHDELRCALQMNDHLTECFQLTPRVCGTDMEWGTLDVTWSRAPLPAGTEQTAPVTGLRATTSLALPPLTSQPAPFLVSVDVPASGRVGVAIPVRVRIANNTRLLQNVLVTVARNETMLSSGYKSVNVTLLPHTTHEVRYDMVPVQSGTCIVPTIQATATRYKMQLIDMKKNRCVFVRPAAVMLV